MAIAKKKKRFFEVEIPLVGKKTQLRAFDKEQLEGRFLKYDLSRTLKGKALEATFLVRVEGEGDEKKATTLPRTIKIMPYFLKRAVRKGTNYVEDSFEAECENANLRVKPFLVTRRKVSRAVRKALRKKAREEIEKYLKSKEYEQVFDDILKNKLQKPLSLTLKKIYPLALCEIRVLKVKEVKEESSKKPSTKKKVKTEKDGEKTEEGLKPKEKAKSDKEIVEEKQDKAEEEIKATSKSKSEKEDKVKEAKKE